MIDDKRDLGNAIALNSSMVNGARLIGPSLAGLLIALAGEGLCFAINSMSYLAVILSLLLMRIPKSTTRPRSTRIWQELRDGLRYAATFEPIRAILLILALASFVGMPYSVLMPIFARDVLHGGPDTLGFLMGASGSGALLGALYLASRKTILGLGRMVPISVTIFGLGLIFFSFSELLLLSLLLLFVIGFGQMIEMALSNTILQTIVDEDKRGRVMSLYTVSIMGMMPLGSLLAGSVASHIGAEWTVRIAGAICIIGAGLFARRLPALRLQTRPIYARRGIIPEIAMGLQSATDAPLQDDPPE
ncbi:MAG: MFS transporter [bacterium]